MAKQTIKKKLASKKKFRFPVIPHYWENFFASILLHLLLPLLPLGIEYWRIGNLQVNTLVLATSMYTISIGITSRSRLIFAISVFVCIALPLLNSDQPTKQSILQSIATWSIIMTFIIHAAERYNRHVADRTPFWEFMES